MIRILSAWMGCSERKPSAKAKMFTWTSEHYQSIATRARSPLPSARNDAPFWTERVILCQQLLFSKLNLCKEKAGRGGRGAEHKALRCTQQSRAAGGSALPAHLLPSPRGAQGTQPLVRFTNRCNCFGLLTSLNLPLSLPFSPPTLCCIFIREAAFKHLEMMFPVETFELFQQFHSMLLFSSAPCCLVLVIGTNSNRKNGKENNAKSSSAKGILTQHGGLISIRSAPGKEILQQGIDPQLQSALSRWALC